MGTARNWERLVRAVSPEFRVPAPDPEVEYLRVNSPTENRPPEWPISGGSARLNGLEASARRGRGRVRGCQQRRHVGAGPDEEEVVDVALRHAVGHELRPDPRQLIAPDVELAERTDAA